MTALSGTDAVTRRSGHHPIAGTGTAPGGMPALTPIVYGRAWDVVVLGGVVAMTLAACLWRAMDSVGGQLTGVLSSGPALSSIAISVIAAALAIRASGELRLDLGSRRCWRGIAAAMLLSGLATLLQSGVFAFAYWQ